MHLGPETIIACATSEHARTALAVIRLSGKSLMPEQWGVFNFLSGPIEPRRSYFSYFYLPEYLNPSVGNIDPIDQNDQLSGAKKLAKIDEVLVTKFSAPKSFTGTYFVVPCYDVFWVANRTE